MKKNPGRKERRQSFKDAGGFKGNKTVGWWI